MHYDVAVIRKMAKTLYSRASWTVVFWTFSGIIGGVYAGVHLQRTAYEGDPQRDLLAFIVPCGLVFGLMGFAIGRSKALEMQFRAQNALCMAEIERNTKRV
jgi:hypothetical protein